MSAPSPSYTISPIAYTLPLLHAAKNLSSTVQGVFLAPLPASSTSNDASLDIQIQDAIPLIHNYTSLTPITEVSLELAEVYAKEKGLGIVGFYLGFAGDEAESGLGRIGERLLEVLKAKNERAFALVINNKRLGAGEIPYTIYTTTKPSPLALENDDLPSGWKLQNESVKGKTLGLIREDKIHRELVDFDDHLEDPTADWLGNETVKQLIRKRI